MLEELRLYPRSQAARSGGRRPGERARTDPRRESRSLSTGFAELPRLGSTGASVPIHNLACIKEEVA